jgi:citrate synthase
MTAGAGSTMPPSDGVSEDTPITIAGHDVAELMGTRTFTEAMLLGVDGRLPDAGRVRVVDAVLVSIMEHGITPSSLATRVVLDGAPESVSGAIAAGLLAVGSRFLGTIEDAAHLLSRIVAGAGEAGLEASAEAEVDRLQAAGQRIPGIGHNLHSTLDPRVPRLLALAFTEQVSGDHVAAFELLPDVVERRLGRRLIPNAAGAVGAVLADLGYRPEDIRGFALVARCAGLFAHVLDERRDPIAREIWQSANRDHPAPHS